MFVQIDFYFSDSNLPFDKFLLEQATDAEDGCALSARASETLAACFEPQFEFHLSRPANTAFVQGSICR